MIDSGIEKKPVLASRWERIFRVGALLVTSLVSLLALIYPFSIRPYSFLLEIGDVAPQDILAPRNLSYQSELLLASEKLAAEEAVSAIYLPADQAITRDQLDKLGKMLEYIESIRTDEFASIEQKVSDIQVIEGVNISGEVIQKILQVDDSSWEVIQQESLRVLEQIMRNTIREDRLRDAQRNLPAYMSFSLTETQTEIVIALVTPFIVPNSLYSEELTAEAKQQASDSVTPVISTYLEGETIVNRGK